MEADGEVDAIVAALRHDPSTGLQLLRGWLRRVLVTESRASLELTNEFDADLEVVVTHDSLELRTQGTESWGPEVAGWGDEEEVASAVWSLRQRALDLLNEESDRRTR